VRAHAETSAEQLGSGGACAAKARWQRRRQPAPVYTGTAPTLQLPGCGDGDGDAGSTTRRGGMAQQLLQSRHLHYCRARPGWHRQQWKARPGPLGKYKLKKYRKVQLKKYKNVACGARGLSKCKKAQDSF
jgi:hypothetical protein